MRLGLYSGKILGFGFQFSGIKGGGWVTTKLRKGRSSSTDPDFGFGVLTSSIVVLIHSIVVLTSSITGFGYHKVEEGEVILVGSGFRVSGFGFRVLTYSIVALTSSIVVLTREGWKGYHESEKGMGILVGSVFRVSGSGSRTSSSVFGVQGFGYEEGRVEGLPQS